METKIINNQIWKRTENGFWENTSDVLVPKSLEDFENLLDSRGNAEYKDMFPFAEQWAKQSNKALTDNGHKNAIWRWDCGLKLDFDGSLLFGLIKFDSRFYPPHKSSIDYNKYQGFMNFYIMGYRYSRVELVEKSLTDLKGLAEVKIQRTAFNFVFISVQCVLILCLIIAFSVLVS